MMAQKGMRLTKASPSGAETRRERENREVAYRAACEGIVLLKNDGVLPLRTKKVALYGAGASRTVKGGTGSGEVNERRSVTILEGLEERGFEVSTRRWLADFETAYAAARDAWMAEKKRRLTHLKPDAFMALLDSGFQPPCGRAVTPEDVSGSETDACVYVLSRISGEGRDRRAEKGDLLLTDGEEEAIRFCAENYPRFVLAINAGAAIDMSFTDRIPGINAILYLCQLGSEGGYAVADILSGRVSPSGRLADTWARRYEDLPFAGEYSYLNGDLKNEFYKEGIYVGYRFFDSFGVEPAYPFGFGLGYTDFAIRCAGVSAPDGRHVTVRAAVTNIGEAYGGKEVVQLYVSSPGRLCQDGDAGSRRVRGAGAVLRPGGPCQLPGGGRVLHPGTRYVHSAAGEFLPEYRRGGDAAPGAGDRGLPAQPCLPPPPASGGAPRPRP